MPTPAETTTEELRDRLSEVRYQLSAIRGGHGRPSSLLVLIDELAVLRAEIERREADARYEHPYA